jgi:hypothetical protein
MSSVLTKMAGIVILIATIGVASCQALLVDAPGVRLPIEQLND